MNTAAGICKHRALLVSVAPKETRTRNDIPLDPCLFQTPYQIGFITKKERRPTALRRGKIGRAARNQGEATGEKEEADWGEAEEPQMVDRCGLYNYRPRKLGEKSLLGE